MNIIEINNPYSPPQAKVSDTLTYGDGSLTDQRFFSRFQRLSRMRFIAYTGLLSVLYTIFLAILLYLEYAYVSYISPYNFGAGFSSKILVDSLFHFYPVNYFGLINYLLIIFYLAIVLFLCIRRCSDMNLAGWFSLFALIPLAVFIWAFYPGTKGKNRFGQPPPPNKILVPLIAIFCWLGLLYMWAEGVFYYVFPVLIFPNSATIYFAPHK